MNTHLLFAPCPSLLALRSSLFAPHHAFGTGERSLLILNRRDVVEIAHARPAPEDSIGSVRYGFADRDDRFALNSSIADIDGGAGGVITHFNVAADV